MWMGKNYAKFPTSVKKKKNDQGEVLIQPNLQDRNRWSKHERGLRDKSKREGSYT
jgi:hypothetical protein